MKISLLVPVYGVEKYIARCAHSLLSQSYRDIEFIFVNDVTPDRSIEILREVIAQYPDREKQVKIVEHIQNRGLSAARNTALDNATGDYIWFIDSDDWIEPNAVALLAENVGDADIITFDVNMVHSNVVRVRVNSIGTSVEEYVSFLLRKKNLVAVWSKLIHRNLYTKNGARFIEGINCGEDNIQSPCIAQHANKIVKLNAPLYNYNIINPTAVSRNITQEYVETIIRGVDILAEFFADTQYAHHLPMMKLQNKIYLLRVSPGELRPLAATMWPEIDYRKFDIPRRHKVMLWLAEKKMWRTLDIYRDGGKKLEKEMKLMWERMAGPKDTSRA